MYENNGVRVGYISIKTTFCLVIALICTTFATCLN